MQKDLEFLGLCPLGCLGSRLLVQLIGCSASRASPCESKSDICDEMQNTDNQKRKPNQELKCKMFEEFICEYIGCQYSFYLAFTATPSRHF